MFETDRDWSRLGDPSAAALFQRLYGRPHVRTDKGGKRWRRADHKHGQEVLHVAGRELAPDLHWDVSPVRRARLVSANEVWKLDSRKAYLNVYPDGNIRFSHRKASGAKQEWPVRRGTSAG